MLINVFDDRYSLVHILIGIATSFSIFWFVVYIFYQIVEFTYKNKDGVEKEPVGNFVGDIFEFFAGYSFMSLGLEVMGWH
jgi:hypothetical protein